MQASAHADDGLAYLHTRDLTTLKGADDDVMAYAREHDRHGLNGAPST